MIFEIYCIPYNEEWLIVKMVEWYRKKLVGHTVIFNIYDNESTDRTPDIARELGCNVFNLDTGGKIKNQEYTDLFNNVWKGSTADYVICISTDEFIDIDPNQLGNSTVIQSIGYDMLGDGTIEIEDLVEGVRNEMQDKAFFSPRDIQEINYSHGAHVCYPVGNVITGDYRPIMCHMNMISKEWILFRYQRGRTRLSEVDIQNKWGTQYFTPDEQILEQHRLLWGVRQIVRTLD